MHTQKKSVKVVVQKEADYVLPVKANHPELLESIELLFREADSVEFRGIDGAETKTVEKIGGRIEGRTYSLLSAEGVPGISEWENCCCVGRVKRERTKSGKTSKEIAYYITSLDFNAEQFGKSARDHWGVENGLHWALDVIFREDSHRYQQKRRAANLSLMRKIALGILTRDKTIKKARATKQMKAVSSPECRNHLLKNCF